MTHSSDLIAAIDIGKTHSRVSVISPSEGVEIWSAKRVNRPVETPLGLQLDVHGIERWLIETLRSAPNRERLGAIVPIAHGAAAVLTDDDEHILAAPDYEDARFEAVNEAYDAQRDAFTSTYSPRLPLGLNLGRQLFYLQTCEPELFARTAGILPYPQFWAWRLSGVMACEVTSLGCHSDLWQPESMRFSALAQRQGWSQLLPDNRFAGETLGPAIGAIGRGAELPATCRVVCGIHDSNASYLRHLIGRRDQPFAVVSSGTWTVVMAHKAALTTLHAEHDMLANVDVFGAPVPTARFMGGREFETIARGTGQASLIALESILARGAMALPSFAAGGPFAGRQGRFVGIEELSQAHYTSLAMLYVALMTDLSLERLGARGAIIVDGPLATSSVFASVLATLRDDAYAFVDEGHSVTQAICYLAGVTGNSQLALRTVEPLASKAIFRYRDQWRAAL